MLHTIADVTTRRAWTRSDQFRASANALYLWEFISALSFPDDLSAFADLCDVVHRVLTTHLSGEGDEDEDEDEDEDVVDRCLALHIIQTAVYEACVRAWTHLRHHVFHEESAAEAAEVSSFQWSVQLAVWACTSSIELFVDEHHPQWARSKQRQEITVAYLKDCRRDSLLRRVAAGRCPDAAAGWTPVPCECPRDFDVRSLGVTRAPSDYTQIECTLAVEALARGWRSVFDVGHGQRRRLWRYIDALQTRCFVLWMIVDHVRSVANGRQPHMVRPAGSGESPQRYEVTSAWVAHVATVLLHARRAQVNALCTFAQADITATVKHADCAQFFDAQFFAGQEGTFHRLVRGFYRWIRELASSQTETVVCEALIASVVKRACYRFGGKEQHMRLHHNDPPVQAYERLNTTNSTSQAEWMMVSLSKLRIHEFWDRLRVPFVFSEFMTMELFNAFVLQQSKQPWKGTVVLSENALLRRGGADRWHWGVKRHPYIVQLFGGFAVIAKQRYFCTQFAAQALVAWIVLTLNGSNGRFDARDAQSITEPRSVFFADELHRLIDTFAK